MVHRRGGVLLVAGFGCERPVPCTILGRTFGLTLNLFLHLHR